MDPLEFRRRNLISGYYRDAYLKPIAANTNGIFQCLEKGAEYIHWDEKRKEYCRSDRIYPKRCWSFCIFL